MMINNKYWKKPPFSASLIFASSLLLIGNEAYSETDLRFDNKLVYERSGNLQMAKYGAVGDQDLDDNGIKDDKEIRYKVSNHWGFLTDNELNDTEKDHEFIETMPVLSKPAKDAFTYASTLGPKYIGPLHYGFQVANKNENPDTSDKKTVISAIEITDLTEGEILDVTAEIYFNRCSGNDIDGKQGNDEPWSPCWNNGLKADNGYGYDQINMYAAFYLGDEYDCVTSNCKWVGDDGGPIKISDWQKRDCDENQHHCGLALPRLKKTITSAEAGKKYLLVVGYAERNSSGSVEKYHHVEVERRRHATGMSVTRFSDSSAVSKRRLKSGTVTQTVQGDNWKDVHGTSAKYYDIFVDEISGLMPGDVIIAEGAARFRIDMDENSCNPLFKDLLVLTTRGSSDIDNANDDRVYHYGGDFINELAWPVSPNNYGNVTNDGSSGTLIQKVGQVAVDSSCGVNCKRTLRWAGTRFKGCATGPNDWKTKSTYDGTNPSFMSYEVYRNLYR